MDARQSLLAAVDGMDPAAKVACTAGQLRAAGWDLPPEVPDERHVAVTVAKIRDLGRPLPEEPCGLSLPSVPCIPPGELPPELTRSCNPCDPDPE